MLYTSKIINELSNFDSFSFGAAHSPGKIIFSSISSFPLNEGADADYTIVFTPITEIPFLGEIKITFPPSQFAALPANPRCSISGGLNTFSSCISIGSTLIVTTNSKYTSGNLALTVKDIRNPIQAFLYFFAFKFNKNTLNEFKNFFLN